eukprot:TRINITY_DN20810_c0_g1_i1.p1 TRINITY_DN20810_c0_g1~~TRINITY_DN20810_c0_g1_i1.p1  ORF type:complete len:271 (-),score=46.67 TRINITY_DN20810_c0_g1_i1:6-818(-)
MLKRAAGNKFVPNAHVFPGGALDPFDRELAGQLDPAAREEMALRICAIRECFEETGILLVRQPQRQLSESELLDWRSRVHKDASQFSSLLERLQAEPDTCGLTRVSHWITPQEFPLRFDTHFYVAVLPSLPLGAQHDGYEASDSGWFTPQEVLQEHANGKMILIDVTWYLLNDLAQFETLDALERDFLAPLRANPGSVVAFHLHLHGYDDNEGGVVMTLPPDPLHPTKDGESVAQRALHRMIVKERETAEGETRRSIKLVRDPRLRPSAL